MAVAIVACPCALALAIPLAMSLSIGRLAKLGVLVRGADALEKMSEIKSVYFDKTGTLTVGELMVVDWMPSRKDLEPLILGLEEKSNHPIAKAIRRQFVEFEEKKIRYDDLKEVFGKGVSGKYSGNTYALQSCDSTGKETEVALLENGKRIATLFFGDVVRPSAARAIRALKRLGIEVGVLSGDQESVVFSVATQLGIPIANSYGQLLPEEKAKFFTRNLKAMMIGDGVNDSIALASASVGLAVKGGMEASMRAAGIYSTSGNPLQIPSLIRIARETMKVIRRNLVFTVLYNVVVISVALTGHLNPIVAAIAMPVSAFTVFTISMMGTRALRKEFREFPT